MLGKVECSTQIELLKNQNKVYSTRTDSTRKRPQQTTKQGQRYHILTTLLSRHLNYVNIAGEISSYLKKEKEVPIFL